MHVRIVEGCIVCRQCECQAPDVFAVDEGAYTARVIDSAPNLDREADIIRAIKGCPAHVIKLRRDKRPAADRPLPILQPPTIASRTWPESPPTPS